MKNRLKRRFIIYSMATVSVLILFLVLTINGLNWFILDRQGSFMVETLADADDIFRSPKPVARPPFAPMMDEDRMNSLQFFIARLDRDGSVLSVETNQLSTIERNTAESMVLKTKGKDRGKTEGYRFLKRGNAIFFLDTSQQRETFFMVLSVSCLMALVCWALVLTVAILLSSRAIRPIVTGMEKQKQFITNASHEMKTPLSVIQTNNETMALIHGENKYNRNIALQTKRMNALVTNMLLLAKHDENAIFHRETINISQLVEEILPTYKEEAERVGLAFSASLSPSLTLKANRESIIQMVSALLDNAMKYTPRNGSVRVSLKKNGKHIVLTEENTISGEKEKDIEVLFERFHRGDSSRAHECATSGFGIGLSAARAIAESFGGRLDATYIGEDGIRFTALF